MGCERLGDPNASPRHQRFHVLVGLLLSSQTKDAVTAAAVRNLQSTIPGGLSPESVNQPEITISELDACISKVGFHNTKAKNLKIIAGVLKEQHGGDVPNTPEELMALPGIGPKMAYLCLSAAWDIHLGIGVDTHVHRITNLWGWHKTKTPEETRAKLEAWLPKENWHEINTLVVGLGQTVCAPGEGRNRRRCGECGLGAVCPASSVKRSLTAKMKKEDAGENAGVKVEVVDIEDMGKL
jgi:endonuclease-3